MQRFSSLDTVRQRIWRRLEAAATEPGHPLRVLPFGTGQGGAPRLRMVVLRDADAGERVLAFHTDRRSQKVADIRDRERVAWLAWDPDTKEQIRLHGTASIHLDDAIADEMWAAESPRSLDVYVREAAPGTPRTAPEDGLEETVNADPVTRDDVSDGRQYFAVVRTVIDEMDWLHLHPEGHYRAQFRFDPDQGGFGGGWVVP